MTPSAARGRVVDMDHQRSTLRWLRHASIPATGALALVFAAPAGAASGLFSARTLVEPAKPGLAVTGVLHDLAATSSARVIAPTSWHRRSAPAGRLRFATTQNPSCRYDLTYTVRSALGSSQEATDRVAAALPAPASRYLLDSGARGNQAFRVVRRPGIGGRVRLDALWAGILTRRADIAPGGQSAWTEIRVSAISRAGDECHAGTWREALGPTIGDSLAVAHTRLHFTKKG
jgi:hypothetical protein